MNRFLYIVILLFLPLLLTIGQITNKDKYIQVSGIISDADSNPVPNVNVISLKLRRGTTSEQTGIYSLISLPGDTIFFSALGYKKIQVYIPAIIEGRHFTHDVILMNDTINIKDVVILPWKTYDDFKRAVLANRSVKPEIQNMYDNMASIQYSILNSSDAKISPEAAYRYVMLQNANAMMTKNQYPVNNLLNPFAWAKFFKEIKNGLFKSHKNQQSNTKAKVKKKKETETETNN